MTLPLVLLFVATVVAYGIYANRITRHILSSYDVDNGVFPTIRAKFFALDDPAHGSKEIDYEVTERGWTHLLVTDTAGHTVATLVDGEKLPGRYCVKLDVSMLSAGTYLYVLQTPTRTLNKAMRGRHDPPMLAL